MPHAAPADGSSLGTRTGPLQPSQPLILPVLRPTQRLQPRFVVRNCTMVLPLAREVDIKRYWAGVFNSPQASTWLRKGLNVTAWEVRAFGGWRGWNV